MTILRMLVIWLPALTLSLYSDKKDLYLMGLLPMTGDTWPGGGACLPPMEMAIRQINEREDILPGYRLNLIWKDTACDAGKAINALYDMLYTEPTKHIIVGPACSVEAEVTALAASAWNITHLANGAASPLLSDTKKYPRFFRLVSPDTRYNLLRIALLREFGWTRVATINAALDYFSAVTDDLVISLEGTDIKVISQEIFEKYPMARLQSLKEKDTRIILAAAYQNQARKLMCAAYRVGLYGPKVVWIFPGWYMDKWWVDPNNETTCTEEQMAQVAEGSLLTGFFYWNLNENKRGIANITTKEFSESLIALPTYNPNLTAYGFLGPNSFDAIWGSALALNCTETVLQNSGSPKTVDQFDYSDREMADMLTSCVRNLSFDGISGHIKFGYYGDPQKNIRLDQIQDGEKVMVGVYRTDVPEPYLVWHNGGVRWKDGIIPRDSTVINKVEIVISRHIYIVMSCFAGFGIVLAVCFFIFNIIHRKNAYVKLSSPNINNVLLAGCILTYSCVFMESLKAQHAVLCKMKLFTLTIGFSTAFGALFSKTWRVYKIFSNKKLLQVRIRDSTLIGIVLVLVVVQTCILVFWEIFDPIHIVIKELHSKAFITASDVQIFYIRVCTSRFQSYFSLTIYITVGILLAFGAFLAYETRKVKIPALNDSRLIGACLYNVIVLSAVGVTLNVSLQEQVGLVYGIMSAILIIGATSTQLVVFIPKVMAVYYPHRIEASSNSAPFNEVPMPSKPMVPRNPCLKQETHITSL